MLMVNGFLDGCSTSTLDLVHGSSGSWARVGSA